MDNHQPSATTELGATIEPLQALEQLIQSDPTFAEALRSTDTTEAAASSICERGITLTPEALWRHRGKLEHGGRPTWRG